MAVTHKRIEEILGIPNPGDKISRFFDYFILTLIILNVLSVIVESTEGISSTALHYLRIFEIVSVIIFTIEYIARIWTAAISNPDISPLKAIRKFAFSPMSIVDLIAIVPFYISLLLPFEGSALRAFRILRLTRLIKMGRHSKSLKIIGKVVKSKRSELIVTGFISFLLLLLSSILIYFAEHDAQPEAFPDVSESFWWSVGILTKVRLGDAIPITVLGRWVTFFISFMGIGLFALPTAILGSAFLEEIRDNDSKL